MADEMVPIFRVKDAIRAATFYARMGFVLESTHQFEADFPVYAFLTRNGAQLHLSEHRGDAPKKSLCYLWVDDVDAIAARYALTVEKQPWAREVTVVDLDGNRMRCGQRNSGVDDQTPNNKPAG